MIGSIDRVRDAAVKAGLAIEIRRMDGSTRTAEDAAAQCGCDVAQIVKSLIFAGKSSGRLYLFLVSGSQQLDVSKASDMAGELLVRADPRKVRDETGFAIGGVAPIGHVVPLTTFADSNLTRFDIVWAAGGAHDAVFSANPRELLAAANATIADIATPMPPATR